MENGYSIFNHCETRGQDCPILWKPVDLKESEHPKATIILKTGNKNYGFHTLSLWKWMKRRPTHPMTNLKLKANEIERINFYKESLDYFPEITRGTLKIGEQLEKFFQNNVPMTPKDWSILDYFVDIEDFKPYMFTLPESFRINATRIMGLLGNDKHWMLRQCSIADVKNEHEYYAVSTFRHHYAIRHSFGQGYWSVKSAFDDSPIFLAPSFMRCLKRLNLSLENLVWGGMVPLQILVKGMGENEILNKKKIKKEVGTLP